MKKNVRITAIVSIVASVGLWLGLGSVASAQPVIARPAVADVSSHAKATPTAAESDPSEDSSDDADTVQSGDQTTPDDGTEAGSETESESGAGTETDGVDCQQDGNFDGVNAAGTGPGCDGSGT
ncbi:MAG: hypothetical protein ABI595_00770 [Actinomycetota bacterium]